MRLNLLQIFNLAGCPAPQIIASCQAARVPLSPLHHRRAAVFCMTRIHRFDQAQLNLLDAQMMLCLAVEILQYFCRKRGLACLTPQTEMFSAPGDGDIKHGFNLPEVFIQRPAEIGKALVVDRGKRNFDRVWVSKAQ